MKLQILIAALVLLSSTYGATAQDSNLSRVEGDTLLTTSGYKIVQGQR